MYTGIITLFILTLVLLAPLRIHIFERYFKGLRRLYHGHHFLALTMMVFLLVHIFVHLKPLYQLVETKTEILNLLFDPQDLLIFSGTWSFLFFLICLVSSYFKKISFRVWLFLHRFALYGFAALLVHLWFFQQYRAWQIQSVIGLFLVGVCIIFLLVFYFFPNWIQSDFKFKVQKVIRRSDELVELVIRLFPNNQKWPSGTYGFFRFDCTGSCGVSRMEHPFTILQTETGGDLHILVKTAGQDTARLQSIQQGTEGHVTGPYGEFLSLSKKNCPQLWIAGGVGFAPFMGLLNQSDFIYPISLVLIVFVRNKNLSPYLEVLQKCDRTIANLRVLIIEDQNQNRLSVEELQKLIPDIKERCLAIAGPPKMIRYWRKLFRRIGIANSKIFTEEFL